MAAATINNKNRIIVDLDVWNCQIRVFKPEIQTRMALSDVEKMLFWNNAPLDRLNNRIMGELKGAALRKAKHVIDKHGALNMSGIYGSIEIDEKDFIPYTKR
jgi:hypothetical protein